MIPITGGTFTMGSPKAAIDSGEASDDEVEHQVTLTPYCIDQTEVTVAAYRQCATKMQNGVQCSGFPSTSRHPADDRSFDKWCNGNDLLRESDPINCVEWSMANVYCRWAGKSLPTEAQWEHAARGAVGRSYPWGDEQPDASRINACGPECAQMDSSSIPDVMPGVMYEEGDRWPTTAPTGLVPGDVSAFGVRDMAGNVHEWVADWYAPYDISASTDPLRHTALPGDARRVVRGGSWRSFKPSEARNAARRKALPEMRHIAVGFRCAKAQAPEGQ